MKSNLTKTQQAKKILAEAEKRGVSTNYFFATTFERYKEQLRFLKKLKKTIDENDVLVTKEYVKGRENIVVNPAITEYNKTATAANGTVTTLIGIIKGFSEDEKGEKDSALAEILKAMKE